VILEPPDAIVVCEPSGRILLANEDVERLLGHAPAKLVGRALETLLPRAAAGRLEVALRLQGPPDALGGHR
jgi:PAS domain S-box-containing protein